MLPCIVTGVAELTVKIDAHAPGEVALWELVGI